MHQGTNDGGLGIKAHTRQRVTLVLEKGRQGYLIGPASTDSRAATLVGRTTLSAAEAALQTTLSITSNTDTTTYPGTTITMTASDIIGIELNDGTIHWSTISGTPGATADIAAGIASAAAAGNYVYWFTSRAQRLVHVESAVLREEGYTTTPLHVYRTVQAYEEGVSDKYADGDPTCILVEPLLLNTRVTLNSQPNDVTKQIVVTGWYPQEDYDATTNDVAFPQEAFRFLCWELSKEIAPAFGATWDQTKEDLRQEARMAFFGLNPEVSDAHFQCGGV